MPEHRGTRADSVVIERAWGVCSVDVSSCGPWGRLTTFRGGGVVAPSYRSVSAKSAFLSLPPLRTKTD